MRIKNTQSRANPRGQGNFGFLDFSNGLHPSRPADLCDVVLIGAPRRGQRINTEPSNGWTSKATAPLNLHCGSSRTHHLDVFHSVSQSSAVAVDSTQAASPNSPRGSLPTPSVRARGSILGSPCRTLRGTTAAHCAGPSRGPPTPQRKKPRIHPGSLSRRSVRRCVAIPGPHGKPIQPHA